MNKKEIELIEKEIEDNLKAGECGLASNNEKFQWTNTANAMKKMLEENKKLKGNWNMLKEYIKETKLKEFEKSYGKRYGRTFTQAEIVVCNMILDKMQELEGSDSNDSN
jgi:hypothetical protein